VQAVRRRCEKRRVSFEGFSPPLHPCPSGKKNKASVFPQVEEENGS
jgi:hypothetical protein